MHIILFGPNGSGKGTQGFMLAKVLDLKHVESGALFRRHIQENTPLGREAKGFINYGNLAPDAVTFPMVQSALEEAGPGWLLDGFPRTIRQTEHLWSTLKSLGITLDLVVEIQLDRHLAKQRIMGRRACTKDASHPNNVQMPGLQPVDGRCRVCGAALAQRADDQDEAAIDRRHATYYDANTGTLAALAFFKDKARAGAFRYLPIPGEGDIRDVKEHLLREVAQQVF